MPGPHNQNPFELRMHRLLIHLGYFVRRNIILKEEYSDSPVTIGEIDVLGFRYSPTFQKEIVIVESKRRRKRKPHDRCLWLKGLMDYFNANQGILLLDSFPWGMWEFSKKLGISLLDNTGLVNFERNLSVEKKEGIIPIEYLSNPELEEKMKKKKNPWINSCVNYLQNSYWKDPTYLQIKRLIGIAQNNKKEFNQGNLLNRWIVNECIILFSLSMIQLAAYLRTSIGTLTFEQDIIIALEGGHAQKADVERQVKQWARFFDTYLQEHHSASFALTESDLLERIVPDGVHDIADLVSRSLKSPLSTVHAPQILDMVLNGSLIKGKAPTYQDIQSIIPITGNIKRDVKIAKNFVIAFNRIIDLEIKYYKPFIEMM